ncbi:MAG: phosphoglycerate dehydrogenase [Myxococcota bacterium]|nr:phosphoglycerate dehydrogenase [Myxococcota bacterium]
MVYSFPREKIKVVLLEGVHQTAVDGFKNAGYTHVEYHKSALSPADLRAVLEDAYIVGVRSRTQLTAEVLDTAPKLVAVGCFCIGTNQVDLDHAMGRGVPVFNAPHSNTRSVAELVLAETIMLLRGISDKNRGAHEGVWLKSAANSYEVRGKSIGIVGYGHIGSQVSILAEAFGMRVYYYDTEPKLPMGNATQLPSLEELLGCCDVVTLHVPQADDTANLMSHEMIAKVKDGAIVLNLSRGSVVDLDALAEAIRGGRIRGAAVDVFPVEPKSNKDVFKSPLQGLANVILTPHIGGSTLEAQKNIGIEVSRKLVQYSDHGSTIGAVNFPSISLAKHTAARRILHVHRNRPGVLRQINRTFADADANILGQHLQTMGALGYVVTDFEEGLDEENLLTELQGIEETIKCRILY